LEVADAVTLSAAEPSEHSESRRRELVIAASKALPAIAGSYLSLFKYCLSEF
jgi:hypothetical protein